MKKLAAISPAALRHQSNQALAREICPVGKCRVAVRGLALSKSRSTIRLNAMAQVRAETIAPKISPTVFSPGQPCSSRAATTIAARANGRAKTVWENLTKAAHFFSKDKLEDG